MLAYKIRTLDSGNYFTHLDLVDGANSYTHNNNESPLFGTEEVERIVGSASAGKCQCKLRLPREFYIEAFLFVIGRQGNDRSFLQIIIHFSFATAHDGTVN